jgi:hypothetical protein
LKKLFLFLGIVLPVIHLSAQNVFSCIIKDVQSQEHLQNVSVILKGTSVGIASDSSGRAIIKNIPNGNMFLYLQV